MLRNSLQYRLNYLGQYEIFSLTYLNTILLHFLRGKNSYRIREKLDIK
jgi:hypothetical protein